MKKSLIACGLLIAIALVAQATCGASANAFDHEYRSLADALKDHVRERAILGAIVKYGPPAAADLARTGRPAIRYLSYDWSLNDVQR